MTDQELLAEYVGGSEPAFERIVARHLYWVYQSAQRQVRDRHLAEDVTQTVFLILSRKAASAQRSKHVGAWLFNVVRYCCWDVKKKEARRIRHEQEAMKMMMQNPSEEQTRDVRERMDELIAKMGAKDRAALLLRFYEDKTFSQIGQEIGISEEAARKRIDRAVEKLSQKFAGKGVVTSAVALGAAITAEKSQAVAMSPQQVIAQMSAHAEPAQVAMKMMQKAKAVKLAGASLFAAAVALLLWMWLGGSGSQPLAVAKSNPVATQPVKVAPEINRSAIVLGNPWPLALPGSITSTPSVADLFGDGRKEIVVTCMARKEDGKYPHPQPNDAALVFAFYANGSLVDGFPVEVVPAAVHARKRNQGLYQEAWFSSPSVVPATKEEHERLVLATPFGQGVCVIRNDGSIQRFSTGNQWNPVPLVDLEHKGQYDIIMGNLTKTVDGGPLVTWENRNLGGKRDGFAPCIGDARGDGHYEIYHLLYGSRGGGIIGLDDKGRDLEGWPQKISEPSWFAPVMGDVQGRGSMQVIHASNQYICLWNSDGAPAKATHQVGPLSAVLKEGVDGAEASLTLADLDGDGKAEIIVYDVDNQTIRAWDGDGTPVGNDPHGIIATLPQPENMRGSDMGIVPWAGVSVADLDGDGVMDLFCGTWWIKFDPKTKKSTLTPMVPQPLEMNWNQPTIADIEGDGKAEIIFGTRDGRLYVYHTEMSYDEKLVQWATANGDFQHTGCWKVPKR